MSKQSTLFKAWGDRKETSSERAHVPDAPTSSSSVPPSNINLDPVSSNDHEIISIQDDEDDGANFDNDDDFFNNHDFADENLLESYATMDKQLPRPSTSHDPTSSSALHQKTLAFHVGPSHSVLNSSVIEDDIAGFDPEAGELWIYPTNYPLRDYQFNIVQKALFTNTLVCLPTGLGKTFIAAVVMYNFYRWYPNGKVVFLAPTKPLVTQQIEACYNVMGIPQEHAAEMTGHLPPKERVGLWESRRVFFLTPQVMQNDLSRGTCPALDVCCIVFDEAHKALGNHAYCQVVKELAKVEGRFRVLALSATPGNDLKAVQQVVTNLQIGHIELRNEDSFDIQRYVHDRKVEKIIVPLDGEIADVKNNFVKVLNGVINRLARYGVIYHSNTERMSKYQLLRAREQFRINGAPPGVMPGAIESDFALSISLYHAYELLQLHGMRSFHQFLTTTFKEGSQQSRAKMEVLKTPEFVEILRLLGNRLGREDDCIDGGDGMTLRTKNKVVSPRFSITGAPQGPAHQSFFYSHPKLNKLEEVVLNHFRKFENQATIDLTGPSPSSAPSSKKPKVNTRVMIFSEYRESVQEISELLTQHSPLVRVMTFVGHGSGKSSSKGLTQKEQTETVRKFREGGYNTLVATCVGEEGLDIGEVDLIVCFDAAKSPIRLVQRMGRTGRKRDGRIIVMVTEGKEDQIYNKSQSNKKSIHRAIKEGCKNLSFFKQCPRMVPRYISPRVHKMHMTIGEFVSSRPGRKGASAKAGGGGGGKASASGQAKLGFGAASKRKKGEKGGFLSNDELMCWSNELALSDKESRTMVRSVEQCFPTQTEFLSISKLKGGGAKFKPGRKSNSSFVDLSTSFGNSSLNSSSTSQLRRKYHLSLNRWIHCQNAPIPTKMTGHSSKTQQLSSALEFIDLLNSGDGVGQSYDLEMETFLNRDDILSSESQEVRRIDGKSDIQQKKKKSRQIRKILDDSSDEEDFQSETLPGEKDNIAESASPEAAKVDDIVTVEDIQDLNYNDPVDQIDCDEPIKQISPVTEPEEENATFTAYTASQHVVPQAPSLDSLDWLDEMDPSQMPSSIANKDRNPPKPLQEASCSESVSRKGEEFQFITPKAPPSSRRSRIQASSTPISSASSSRKKVTPPSNDKFYQDSVELFDDLPENEIFDDFSDTSLLSSSTSNRKPKVSECIHPVGSIKSTTDVNQRGQQHFRETSTNDDCVIIDSDSEEKEGDREERGCNKSLSNVRESPSASDDSFLQVHGQRRRKRACKAINHLLESPSTQPQQPPQTQAVDLSADVSPGSKENAGTCMLGGVKKSDSAGEWLSTRQPRSKDVKKVTRFNVSNSSDEDDFDVPLMQRIRKKAKVTTTRHEDHTTQSPTAGKKERRVRPRKRKLLDGFVEEEAEVSSDDSDPLSQQQQLHMQDSSEYDMEDSFINDNSMLTQISPSQRERGKSTRTHASTTSAGSSSGTGNMYLRSLMSPEDHLFGGRKRGKVGGGGNQYRMVFSQRHQILNHYIKKAGFNIDDDDGNGGGARKNRKRHRRKRSESEDEEGADSYGEAEEKNFHYGEEDLAEFSQSQGLAMDDDDMQLEADYSDDRTSSYVSVHDSELITDDDRTPVALSRNQKRRPKFLSDSDLDASTSFADHVNTSASKRLKLGGSPSPSKVDNIPIPSAAAAVGRLALPVIDRVVVSPSLLASIKIKKTAPCFSLGMDDWLSAIEDELIDNNERGGPSNNVEEEEELVGVASDGLLLSQEDIYQLDEGFQDSDTELL